MACMVGMDEYTRNRGLPIDARETGSRIAQAIRESGEQ